MKTPLTGLAVAAMLVAGTVLPGFAQDATTPQSPAAQTPAATAAPAEVFDRAAPVDRAEDG